jgi:hypothetical protein
LKELATSRGTGTIRRIETLFGKGLPCFEGTVDIDRGTGTIRRSERLNLASS